MIDPVVQTIITAGIAVLVLIAACRAHRLAGTGDHLNYWVAMVIAIAGLIVIGWSLTDVAYQLGNHP